MVVVFSFHRRFVYIRVYITGSVAFWKSDRPSVPFSQNVFWTQLCRRVPAVVVDQWFSIFYACTVCPVCGMVVFCRHLFNYKSYLRFRVPWGCSVGASDTIILFQLIRRRPSLKVTWRVPRWTEVQAPSQGDIDRPSLRRHERPIIGVTTDGP